MLKNVIRTIFLLAFGITAFGQQNTVVMTTLAAAVTATQNTIRLTSVTGVNAPTAQIAGSFLYIIDVGESAGELVSVSGALSSTTVPVNRTRGGNGVPHASGAIVLIATNPGWFYTSNPTGACTSSSVYVTPWVNTSTGQQWLCSSVTGTWVPGWGNSSAPGQPTTAVASAAGAILPSGPFFHITGTAAITGFTLPVGFTGGQFCAVADAIWTWTAAGNIAVAGTTTAAGRQFCFRYDSNAAKWYPDKVA